MRLPDSFLAELNARTPLASVIGRRVKLTRSGRDFKGCCPFHGEKTPSFYVYPDGFKCFGCGAHGDAISFVMQSQGASFMEAVEQLAGEAGMDLPRPSPEAAESERRRLDLAGVLDAAGRAYAARLRAPEGRAALDYLRRRGLTDETLEKFGLGWSGEGRGALAAELASLGIERPALIEAGLMREADEGRAPYDLFFNRVMFPIRDRRGRVISFGGRTLGDAQPKYVNGPETPLFSKRRSLYALDLAREGVRNGADLIVVEGYMDAIALHQAGFAGAVAPLGTAIGPEQLEELWRLSPAPILCLDGDAAGLRAARRAAETALPLLAPDRTLRLATLPAGEDPDSLLRRPDGRATVTSLLAGARGLSDALFDMLREGVADRAGGVRASPEQRAAFRIRLEEAAKLIPDRALSSEYRAAWLDRFFESGRTPRPAPFARFTPGKPGAKSPLWTPGPPRARAAFDDAAVTTERARILTAILLRHPDLVHDVEAAYAELPLPPPLDRLRAALLGFAAQVSVLDSSSLMTHLHSSELATDAALVLSSVPLPLPACAAEGAMPAEAESGWWHFFGLIQGIGRLEAEVAAMKHELARSLDDRSLATRAQARHIALCSALNRLRRGDQESDPD